MDTVGYGTGDSAEGSAPLTPVHAAGSSFERKALSTSDATSMSAGGADELKGNGYDTNNNKNDFVTRTTRDPQNASSTAERP
jgi:hypothetical protein